MLLNTLAARGHVVVFLGADPFPLRHERVIQVGLRVPFAESENPAFWLGFIIRSVLEGLWSAKRYRTERILTFGPFYTLLLLLPVVFLKIPAVTFIRADNQKHSRNRLRSGFFLLVDALGIRLSRRIVFVSEHLKTVYRRRYAIPEEKIRVVPNHIEEAFRVPASTRDQGRNSLGLASGSLVISTAGKITQGKNFAFLVAAMVQLQEFGIQLLIIGDDTDRTGTLVELKQLSERLGVNRNIRFCGWQRDPRKLISLSDLFILPSYAEGSPNVLLEALSCDIPCMGSRVEGIEELLCYDELLFPLENPEVLIGKVKRLRNSHSEYSRLKSLSRKRYHKYCFDWAGDILAILRDI